MRKLFILFVLVLLLFPSCHEEKSNDLNIAISQDVANLDVMKSTSRVLRDILVGSVYEKLFTLDNGTVKNELATGYEIAEDGKALRIYLREGVNMHDGSLMTAEDVASSLNRYIDSYGAAKDMTGGAKFKAEDGSVFIESDKELYLFPYLLSSSPQSAVITKEGALKENEYGLITDIVGTGPYVLSSYTPGSEIVLSRFDNYSEYGDESEGLGGRKHAYMDRLIFHIVPDSTVRRLALEKGEYDFINDVMSYDIPSLSQNKDITLLGADESGSIALVFNKKSTLSSDLEFRKAVAYALDYDGLMRACYGDFGYSIHSDYMEKEQILFSLSGDPYLEQDKEKAKEALSLSSYSGESFRILTSNLSNLEKIAIAASSMLEDVGIKTEIIVLDWVGFLDKRNDPESYDIFISAFSSVTLPQMKLYFSSSYPGWYESEEKDAIISSLSECKSIEEASLIWKDAQIYFWQNLPVIVPGHYSTINAVRSDISGVINEDGNHFWNARRN